MGEMWLVMMVDWNITCAGETAWAGRIESLLPMGRTSLIPMAGKNVSGNDVPGPRPAGANLRDAHAVVGIFCYGDGRLHGRDRFRSDLQFQRPYDSQRRVFSARRIA